MILNVLLFICKQLHWLGRIASVLSWFGQHTLFIMGFDYFAGSLTRSVLSKVGFQNWLLIFILKPAFLTAGCMAWNWAIMEDIISAYPIGGIKFKADACQKKEITKCSNT